MILTRKLKFSMTVACGYSSHLILASLCLLDTSLCFSSFSDLAMHLPVETHISSLFAPHYKEWRTGSVIHVTAVDVVWLHEHVAKCIASCVPSADLQCTCP